MTACIACRGTAIREFLNLGDMSLANKFLTREYRKPYVVPDKV